MLPHTTCGVYIYMYMYLRVDTTTLSIYTHIMWHMSDFKLAEWIILGLRTMLTTRNRESEKVALTVYTNFQQTSPMLL